MSQLTRRGIQTEFLRLLNLKPMDRISVTEVAKACGISRKTFYNHFQSLDDLVKHTMLEETTSALSAETQRQYWLDSFLDSAGLLLDNKAAFLHLYRSHLHGYVKGYVYSLGAHALETYARGLHKPGTFREEDLRLLISFFANGISGIVADWVRDDMQTDIVPLLTQVGHLLKGNLSAALLRGTQPTQSDLSV